jgi:hypothetical protein
VTRDADADAVGEAIVAAELRFELVMELDAARERCVAALARLKTVALAYCLAEQAGAAECFPASRS